MANEFLYEGEKYQIDASRRIDNGGDIDPNTKTILVDKDIPEKFHEGIAVHEIEERKLLLKGHSYVFSHNEAQKKELEFYEKTYGKDKGLQTLEEEESVVLTITRRHSVPRKTKILKAEEDEKPENISAGAPFEMRTIQEIIFEGKRYIVDNAEKLIGTLVDVYERGNVIYIDRDVPERFFEALALNELVRRKFLKKGNISYNGKEEKNNYLMQVKKTDKSLYPIFDHDSKRGRIFTEYKFKPKQLEKILKE